MSISYHEDAYGWAMEQAALIRAGRLSELDLENVAEEIESVGKTERRELVNRLAVLLCHLLKWQYQPERRGKSWLVTIRGQRLDIVEHLHDNPSLKPEIKNTMLIAFRKGLDGAILQTDLSEDDLPKVCPWSWSEIIDPDFWPEAS